MLLGIAIASAVVLGTVAYSGGRELVSGQSPPGWLWLVTSAVFLSMVWRSATLTQSRFEQLRPAALLTAVPARTVVLGLLCFVYGRLAAILALPTVGVAIGAGLGLRSLTVPLTIVVATASAAALAVSIGMGSRLAAQFVGRRLTRGRFYRDLLVVFGWVPLIGGVLVLRETSVSLTGLFVWLEFLPVAWFADLALLGAGASESELRRSVGALGTVVVLLPALVSTTIAVARRLWEIEPVSSTGSSGSHTLVGGGLLERLLGDRVSRPVLTVARGCLLVERRVPRGLLSTGYVLVFTSVLLFPAAGLTGAPLLLLVVLALGLAAGIAVGTDPVSRTYRVLPVLCTSIRGRTFVRGTLLAALVVGVPIVTLVVLPLGLLSGASLVETVLLVLFGVSTGACTAAVSLVIGLAVDRDDLVRTPFFFTDVPVYAELGTTPFRRLGTVFAIVTIATLPAFFGNVPLVYETIAALGLPTSVVRSGALLAAILTVTIVSSVASRIAAQRFRDYRLT